MYTLLHYMLCFTYVDMYVPSNAVNPFNILCLANPRPSRRPTHHQDNCVRGWSHTGIPPVRLMNSMVVNNIVWVSHTHQYIIYRYIYHYTCNTRITTHTYICITNTSLGTYTNVYIVYTHMSVYTILWRRKYCYYDHHYYGYIHHSNYML